MFAEAFGDVERLIGVGCVEDGVRTQIVANARQGVAQADVGILVAAVDDRKHVSQIAEQQRAKRLVFGIGMVDQEFDIANEMGQAKLHSDVELLDKLAIGAELIASQDTIELFAEDIDEHVGTTRGRNLEQRIQRRTKTPGPQTLAIVFVAGLVDVEPIFVRQQSQQFVVGIVQAVADFPD